MKTKFFMLSLALIMLGGVSVFAAKKKAFTGKITYQISTDSPGIPEQAKAMLPKTMVMYIGEEKTKTELFTQMGNQSSIEDLNEKSKVGLLDMMGQKFAISESYDDILKEKEELPELEMEYTDETKEIAGYTCKKVVAKKAADGSVFMTTWVTDDMEVHENINFSNPAFDGLKGVMLQFEVEAGQGLMLVFTAVEVEQKKIKDNVFEIPEGYKQTTKEELQSTFGG